ncbi:MAG: Rieske (2Fe-2S) protein [Acidiferrobacteraceae bacterium]
MTPDFVAVAHTRDIGHGRMWCVRLNTHRILIANVEDSYYAVGSICTHEDVSLCTGALQGETVKCPLHGSRFSVRTGAVLDGPAEDALPVYPVHVDGDDILVSLKTEARRS